MRAVNLKSVLMAGAAGFATLAAGAAQAQVADQPETQLDEIIVTAQLRAQDPIEVPFALTAYNGEFLENIGVQDFEELAPFVPGLVVQNQSPNNAAFVIRGITSDSGAATTEPRVSIYQDGVSISKSRGSYVELFDVERVEVAKGPQSTLYGRGALIGAINIIQNKADIDGFDAATRVGAGNLDYWMGELMFNAPLGDTAALRFATRVKTRDGFVENLLGGPDYNSVDTRAFRLSGAWEPSSALRVDLIANYQADEAAGTAFRSIAYSPQDPTSGAVLGGREPWDGAALTERVDFDGGQDIGLEREVWGVTGLVRYDLSDSLTLNSTTAYRKFDAYEVFDADGISLPILSAAEDAQGEQWSQELRLGFDNGGRISGFAGVGVFHEDGSTRTPLQINERLALATLAPGGFLDGNPAAAGTTVLPLSAYQGLAALLLQGSGIPAAFAPGIAANLKPVHIESETNASELTSYDVFGDITFRATDRLEFAAGLRYTRDEKTTGYSSSVVNGRSVLALVQGVLPTVLTTLPPAQQLAYLTALATPGAPVAAPNSALFPPIAMLTQPTANNGDFVYRDSEDDGLTWRLTARYAVSDDASLYATYARGRRPQVLSPSAPDVPLGAPTFTTVEAETVDSFEVGAKAVMMDGRARLEGAVFHYAYENFQTSILSSSGSFVPANAGEASAYGFEGQAMFDVASNFEVFATYGYNHARFETGRFDGNQMRLSPDHAASIGAIWRLDVGGGEIEVQPTYSWRSKVFFDDDNDIPALQSNLVADLVQDEVQEAYGLLNLRVRYAPNGGNWAIEAFGDNLLDEKYIRDAGNTGDLIGMPTFIAGEPRTYGLTVSMRY